MSRLSLSRLLALVLATLGLLASGLSLSPASAAPEQIIRGVVQDQTGKLIDDVTVTAVDRDGNAAGTALTYASEKEDGVQHGFFGVYVAPGRYTLELSKNGYVSTTVEQVRVERGEIAELGDIELIKRQLATRTVGKLSNGTVSPQDKAKVTVTVSCPGGCEDVDPTGKVHVKDGRKSLGSATLGAGDKGKVTITLPKLGKGSYDLKAVYEGAPYLRASSSKSFTLTVKKPNRKRPNARDWLA